MLISTIIGELSDGAVALIDLRADPNVLAKLDMRVNNLRVPGAFVDH